MTWRPFATMLERADTTEVAGLNWARLRSTRPVCKPAPGPASVPRPILGGDGHGERREDNMGWSGATVVREKRQVTLPQEVVQAAGIKVDDQVDWRFEDGEIRGKKLDPETMEVLDLEDLDPKTLAPKEGKPTRESIIKAVRAAREAQR